jgi:hypothetical protein
MYLVAKSTQKNRKGIKGERQPNNTVIANIAKQSVAKDALIVTDYFGRLPYNDSVGRKPHFQPDFLNRTTSVAEAMVSLQ